MLQFRMEDRTLYFRPCVNSIKEEFSLEPFGTSGTQITRTTTIHVSGFAPWVKGAIMCIGMKFVHRYVFTNWSRVVA